MKSWLIKQPSIKIPSKAVFTIRWRPIQSKTKKNQFSVLKCAEETTKKWALTTWWRSSRNHYLEHVAHESFSNQLVPFTYYTTSSKIDEISFFLLTLGTNFPLYGLKKERRTSVEILTTTPSWLAFLLRNCLSTLFQRKTSTKITNCSLLRWKENEIVRKCSKQ